MFDKNIEYKLLRGKPINLKNGLIISQPKLDDIQNYCEDFGGYDAYEGLIYSLTRFSYEFKFDLEDAGIDYKEKNGFDIFLMLNSSDVQQTRKLLNLVFWHYNKEDKKYELENFNLYQKEDSYYFKSEKSNCILDASSINEVREVFMKMFFMEKPRERKPKDDMAKELVKLDIEMKRKEKPKYDIYSIMDSLVWSDNTYDYETIWSLTPHQIYRGYNRVDRIKSFDYFMTGYYSGNIDSKDFKNKVSQVNWIGK